MAHAHSPPFNAWTEDCDLLAAWLRRAGLPSTQHLDRPQKYCGAGIDVRAGIAYQWTSLPGEVVLARHSPRVATELRPQQIFCTP